MDELELINSPLKNISESICNSEVRSFKYIIKDSKTIYLYADDSENDDDEDEDKLLLSPVLTLN